MKHIAKPRTHSQCGQRLDNVTLYEVIPAGQFAFSDKVYHEVILPEELPELIHEYRCSCCNEILKGQDLDYVQKRMRQSNGEGQVTETRVEETKEG